MTEYLIGTSGWHYAHWEGIFYPKGLNKVQWLPFYVQHFNTVELNASFYRQPQARTFAHWKETTPIGFKFSVKVSRFITHIRRLRDVEDALLKCYSSAAELGDKLGAFLYQLPPQMKADESTLLYFLKQLKPSCHHVFEFRNVSWFNDTIFRLLQAHKAGFCVMDMPGLNCPAVATADYAYFRFHGASSKYSSNYSEAELSRWANKIRGLAKDIKTFYIYFNNDHNAYAVINAARLRQMLT